MYASVNKILSRENDDANERKKVEFKSRLAGNSTKLFY
jgi:hypothetical protein